MPRRPLDSRRSTLLCSVATIQSNQSSALICSRDDVRPPQRWWSLEKRNRRVLQILLACVPASALTIATPLANRVEPHIGGLPFFLAYIVIWVLLTPAFMWVVYRLEPPS